MPEYIEREALIAEYDRVHIGKAGGARKLMVEAPTADVVEVRHGEWLNGVTGYACSVCNKQEPTKRFLYCPNCGAKMDGKEVANNG